MRGISHVYTPIPLHSFNLSTYNAALPLIYHHSAESLNMQGDQGRKGTSDVYPWHNFESRESSMLG